MTKRIDFKGCIIDGEAIYVGYLDGEQYYTIRRTGSHQKWTAFDNDGNVVDKDQYRYDLFERLELQVIPCEYK